MVLALIAAAWWLWLMRGTTFFYDEWDFVLAYNQPLASALVAPHNGQFVAVPVLLYRGMFSLFGTSHYWPYRVMGIVFELTMVSVFLGYARRRSGAAFALAGAVLLLGSGQAFQDILWPFEVTFTVSLAAGVGALQLAEGAGRARQALAAALLVVSTASSGFGLVFLAGVVVEGVWASASRRAVGSGAQEAGPGLRGTWVVVPALVMYVVWYFAEHVGDAGFSHLGAAPAYIAQSAGYGVGSLVGSHSLALGEVLAALLAVALVVRLAQEPTTGARLGMAVTAALTFWVLAALARGVSEPGASRYLQPDGLLVLLAVGELFTGWRPRLPAWVVGRRGQRRSARAGRPAWRGRTAVGPSLLLLVPVLVALAVLSNSVTLVDGARGLRSDSALVKADLASVELAGRALPATFQPAPQVAPQVTVGPWTAATRTMGGQADSLSQLEAAPEADRESADAVLLAAMRPVVKPLPARAVDAPATWRGACGPAGFVQGTEAVVLPLGGQGLLIGTTGGRGQVSLRLFASQFTAQGVVGVGAGLSALTWSHYLPLPGRHWTAEIVAPAQARACRLGGRRQIG